MTIFGDSCTKILPVDETSFRAWLHEIDRDGDGRISLDELLDALRALGQRCAWWKAWRAVTHADLNHNHFIDGASEMEELKRYAAKWGLVFGKDGDIKLR